MSLTIITARPGPTKHRDDYQQRKIGEKDTPQNKKNVEYPIWIIYYPSANQSKKIDNGIHPSLIIVYQVEVLHNSHSLFFERFKTEEVPSAKSNEVKSLVLFPKRRFSICIT